MKYIKLLQLYLVLEFLNGVPSIYNRTGMLFLATFWISTAAYGYLKIISPVTAPTIKTIDYQC